MSFLFPAMLAGLVGLAVPIALHLIAKHRFPVQDFPSIRLLQKDVRTNVFAPKLVDIPQLLLRLLVLILLVLAMSRLFSMGGNTGEAPRNLVVIVDASAGMRAQLTDAQTQQKTALFERARTEARLMIEKLQSPSQCAVILAGVRPDVLTPLDANTAGALNVLKGIETVDGAGCGLVSAVAAGCDLVAGRREAVSQIVVLTDLRANAFTAREQRDLQRIEQIRKARGEQLQIILVDLAAGVEIPNVAVVDAAVRGRGARVGDDAHVVARVVNSSTEKTTARMRLQIGDRKEPQTKDIPLEPGAEAVVDMTARVQRASNSVASVHVGEDAMAFDDSFSVPLNISDTRRLLIINGATQGTAGPATPLSNLSGSNDTKAAANTSDEDVLDGATILRFVLNPGRELGAASGTGIDVTVVTPEALAGQTLSKYDIVALYDVSMLSDAALDDLTTFVKEGRSALIFCAGRSQALSFNRTLAAGNAKRPALAPALIGNDLALENPAEIQQAGNTHPLLTPFQDKLHGDLSVIRFSKVREIQSLAEGASVALKSGTGQTLAVEQPLGRGRVILLTFGLELDRGNIARARAFPALMWRTVAYLTGQLRQRPPDVVRALSPAVLDVSEPAFSFAESLDLSPELRTGDEKSAAAPVRLANSAERTIQVPPLPAGKFVLGKASQGGEARAGYTRYVTTYIDAAESDTRRQAEAELPMLFGGETRIIAAKDAGSLALPGSEFWKVLIVALMLAYLGEAVLGFLLSRKRERERAATEGGAA